MRSVHRLRLGALIEQALASPDGDWHAIDFVVVPENAVSHDQKRSAERLPIQAEVDREA